MVLFRVSPVHGVLYNCTVVGAGSKCYDTGSSNPEFNISYYVCKHQAGECNATVQSYKASCEFAGYGDDGSHKCYQTPNPPNGYSTYSSCVNNCKCTGGGCKTYAYYPCINGRCQNSDSTCITKNDCRGECIDRWPVTCPGSGSGSPIGVLACCTGSGYTPPCSPSCPTPSCIVTDAMCASANSGNTNYKATSTGGSLCKGNDASCTNNDGCGGSKVCATSSCYSPETNTNTIPSVTSMRMHITNPPISGISTTTSITDLSTSSSSPTLVRYPFPNSTTKTVINDASLPTGARTIRSTLSGTRVKGVNDPFYEYTNAPTLSSMTQGYQGIFTSYFETQNKCNDNWQKGTERKGYFQVNTLPTSNVTSIIGTQVTSDSLSGCEPLAKYTGNNNNRILTLTVEGNDINGNDTINGTVIWLVKDGHNITTEREQLTYVGPSKAYADVNKIGIFVTKQGTVYVSNNNGGTLSGWGRDNLGANDPHPIYTKNGDKEVELIKDIQVIEKETSANNVMKIQLTFSKNSKLSGNYKVYSGMTDTLSYIRIGSNTSIDQRSINLSRIQEWNFDFENPTLEDVGTEVDDAQNVTLKWTAEDNIPNGIRGNHTVVNVYKTGSDASLINRTSPTDPAPNEITPGTGEDSPNAGKLSPLEYGWIHPTSGTTLMTVNIGDNSDGTLYFYITVYDNACNYVKTGEQNEDGTVPPPPSHNLNKWIATKGGVFYSRGSVNYPTNSTHAEKYNLGTELLSTFSSSIRTVVNYSSEPYTPPALAISAYDVNNTEGLYGRLNENLNNIIPSLGTPVLEDGEDLTCSEPQGCIWSDQKEITDITYSGNIIITGKNIKISGDIKQSSDGDSMFIFSTGSIEIGGEALTTSDVIHTDTIEAFLLAKDNIKILPEAEEGNLHDRVVINGGIIAFGEGEVTGPAFSLSRTLGLYNPTYPVITVNYHPKYAVASNLFFGLQRRAYKREVGFKSM